MEKKEEFCNNCDSLIVDDEKFSVKGGAIVCVDCFDDYEECSSCEQMTSRYIVTRDTESYFCDTDPCIDSLFECLRCDAFLEDADNMQNGICLGCVRATQGKINYRDFDKKSTKFKSDSEGKIIKSKRPFGVELEMVSAEVLALSKLSNSLEREVGVSRDGSIQGGFGIEIQTPILSGSVGEKTLIEIVKKSKECNLTVNETCGTHCHLDGSDFSDHKQKLQMLEKVNDYNFRCLGFVFDIKNKSFLNEVKKLRNTTIYHIQHQNYSNEARTIMSTFVLPQVTPHGELGELIVNSTKGQQDLVYCHFTEGERITYGDLTGMLLFGNIKMFACDTKTEDKQKYEKLKTLLAFYLVFDDVLLAMLSEDRRNNEFCKPVKDRYALADIINAKTRQELERLWYNKTGVRGTNGGSDRANVEDRKQDPHDSTRYVGANFHSLFGRNGTLEIRYHSGTLDEKKILSWVSLHQTVMDKVSSGKITLDGICQANRNIRFDKKLTAFLSLVELDESLKKYVVGRIKLYNK